MIDSPLKLRLIYYKLTGEAFAAMLAKGDHSWYGGTTKVLTGICNPTSDIFSAVNCPGQLL
jgi:hypothetical protein